MSGLFECTVCGCIFNVESIHTPTTFSCIPLKVVLIRDGNMGRLILDELTVLEDRVQGSNVSCNVSSHLYVGGVPPGTAQSNIQVCVKV